MSHHQPVQVRWYNAEKTVLLYVVPPRFTWDDYMTAVQHEQAHLSTQTTMSYATIADLTRVQAFPPSPLGFVRKVHRMYPAASERLERCVLISEAVKVRAGVDVLRLALPQIGAKYTTASTLQDALRQIKALRRRTTGRLDERLGPV